MKIVVTDGYTTTGQDLNWDLLSTLGNLTVYDRTPAYQIIERCSDADIVLTNKTPFSRETLGSLPHLRCISVLATGYNVIDVEAAREQGIVVCNLPGYGTASVAQHVFALLLELTNAVALHSQSVKEGMWQQSPDWAYTLLSTLELSGKVLGIVGFGNIGRKVAAIATAFGMRVLFFNPSQKSSDTATQVPLELLFRESDVVTLHCPLMTENRRFVNKELLQLMKPTAFLINTARGLLVNESDLAEALNNAAIAGAALDVLSTEPPGDAQRSLIEAKNCHITPHNAWMTREARTRVLTMTFENISAFLNGNPINRVV